MKKTRGFTLTELLISMSLSVLLASIIMKSIFAMNQIFHQISDQVFLDHHGVIAMTVMENQIKSAVNIELSKNSIQADKVRFFISKSNVQEMPGLFLKNDRSTTEFVPNLDSLNAKWRDKKHLHIQIHLIAPYGLQETFGKTVELNNA